MEQGTDIPVWDGGSSTGPVSISMFVAGKPAPQGSMRSFGKGRMVSDNPNTMPWREAIVGQAIRSGYAGLRLSEPLTIDVVFLFSHLKKHYNSKGILRDDHPTYVSVPPDIDKLCRAVLDALTQAGVVTDDSVFVKLAAVKRYTTGQPGALIMIGGEDA